MEDDNVSDVDYEGSGPTYFVNSLDEIIGLSIRSVINAQVMNIFSRLKHLKYLNLTTCEINDISPLSYLTNLQILYIGGNHVTNIASLKNCKKLERLIVWENPINDLDILSDMPQLVQLNCQEMNITDLTFLGKNNNLIKLNADRNKIRSVCFENISKIEFLSLRNNQIVDITFLSSLNKNITSIWLNDNCITEIPFEVAEKFNWLEDSLEDNIFYYDNKYDAKESRLFINGNPLCFPPLSVLELGKNTVKNYYETAEKFGHGPLLEGRIIAVGDGSSGKSSLIERILYNSFELGKGQTNGVKIEHWKVAHDDLGALTFHIWDFGGQEIQHAIHKFFLTEGCLYILVLDNRKEEEPEYWLQQIESLGGKAPVLVVFNKHDENATEIADRKFLKEKYSNIVGFYNISCKTGYGLDLFKTDLEHHAKKLQTVKEQFPNNWFIIKKEIDKYTSGAQHYIDYRKYQEICNDNNVTSDKTQKLLLKYFTTIGAVTWFGDTYLNFLHVLSPAWITQGVYKIITSKKTSELSGKIEVSDFGEILTPSTKDDYVYNQSHYGYILSMMKKFDLCYSPDDNKLLIPSAFVKIPRVEYKEFKGEYVRTYILQFKDYMPMALIHQFTAKNLAEAFDNNYWYSGIVIKDNKTKALSMIQADKEAKRIYVRIKDDNPLGVWEHIRRELQSIISTYAKINYGEFVSLDDKTNATVDYKDLISHIEAGKKTYFHPRLKKDFNVGYLMGLFESKEMTIAKAQRGEIFSENNNRNADSVSPIVLQILNNNSPTISANFTNQISIDIDLNLVNEIGSNLKGDSTYLLEELGESNKILIETLQKVVAFAEDAKAAKNSGDVKEKGWGRKLKNIIEVLGKSGASLKGIKDGGEALRSILNGIRHLAEQFNLADLGEWFRHL